MLISNHTQEGIDILCFLYTYKFQCHFTHPLFSNQFQIFLFGLGNKQTQSNHLNSLSWSHVRKHLEIFPSQGSYTAFPGAVASLIFMSNHCDSLVNKPDDKSIFPVICDKNSSEALFMQSRSPGLKYVVILFHKGPRQQSIYFTLLDLIKGMA